MTTTLACLKIIADTFSTWHCSNTCLSAQDQQTTKGTAFTQVVNTC